MCVASCRTSTSSRESPADSARELTDSATRPFCWESVIPFTILHKHQECQAFNQHTWYTTPATQGPYGCAAATDGEFNTDVDDLQIVWLGDSGQVMGYCLLQPMACIHTKYRLMISLGVAKAHLTMVAAYSSRNCCCDTLELVVSQVLAAAAQSAAPAEDAAAGRAQKLGSHKAVSSRDAVMSTPKGTRPRALHASTCRQQTNQLLTNLLLLPLWGHVIRTRPCEECRAEFKNMTHVSYCLLTRRIPRATSSLDCDSSQSRTWCHSCQHTQGTIRPILIVIVKDGQCFTLQAIPTWP